MARSDKFAFIGTAHVLLGAFSATGAGLTPLGEQAEVVLPYSGGNKAMVRTAGGHPSAAGGIDYGRTVGLNLSLDNVSAEILDLVVSAAMVDAAGNVGMATSGSAIVPVSAVVIPVGNINRVTGAVIDLTKVHWLPFLTDDGEFSATYNNTRGTTANTPLAVAMTGLVEDKYGATPLPEGTKNYFHGSPASFGLTWKLPAPYQAP